MAVCFRSRLRACHLAARTSWKLYFTSKSMRVRVPPRLVGGPGFALLAPCVCSDAKVHGVGGRDWCFTRDRGTLSGWRSALPLSLLASFFQTRCVARTQTCLGHSLGGHTPTIHWGRFGYNRSDKREDTARSRHDGGIHDEGRQGQQATRRAGGTTTKHDDEQGRESWQHIESSGRPRDHEP